MRGLLLLVFLLFSTSAFADASESPVMNWAAHAFITFLGVIFAMRLAVVAFARPAFDVVGVPTDPKYLTNSQNYWLGLAAFVLIAATLFLVLLLLNAEVMAVINLFKIPILPPDILKQISEHLSAKSVPYLVVVSFIGAVYLYLLHKEADWNVVLMLRDVIHTWIAIPGRAKVVVRKIIHSLTVSDEYIQAVIDSTRTTGVNKRDFRKDRDSIERVWAEISYMQFWLRQRQESGDVKFFNEEDGFDLDGPAADYQRAAPAVAQVKQNPTPDFLVTIRATLKVLHARLARLIGCYLIYKHGIGDRLDKAMATFGAPAAPPSDPSPLKYIAIYLITVALSVYVGVCISAILFDWLFRMSLWDALNNQDPGLVLRWIGYSAANYGVPIIIVLSIRYFEWAFYKKGNNAFIVTYCWTSIIALLTGPFSLALTAKYIFPVPRFADWSLLETFGYELRWGVGPAIITVFISYYMDRQTSSVLPDIVQTRSSIGWRIFLSLSVTLVTLLLLLIPIMSITGAPSGTPPGGGWTTEKLRFVATGTTFFIVFWLAMVGQFGLWKTQNSVPVAPAVGPAS